MCRGRTTTRKDCKNNRQGRKGSSSQQAKSDKAARECLHQGEQVPQGGRFAFELTKKKDSLSAGPAAEEQNLREEHNGHP